jgi:hypothetical protein
MKDNRGWTSCREQLPDNAREVLVLEGHLQYLAQHYLAGKCWVRYEPPNYYCCPLYWREALAEPEDYDEELSDVFWRRETYR